MHSVHSSNDGESDHGLSPVTNLWTQWKQKLTLAFHFADEETQAQRGVRTAPTASPGAQTPAVGSARPPSPGFGLESLARYLPVSLLTELTYLHF